MAQLRNNTLSNPFSRKSPSHPQSHTQTLLQSRIHGNPQILVGSLINWQSASVEQLVFGYSFKRGQLTPARQRLYSIFQRGNSLVHRALSLEGQTLFDQHPHALRHVGRGIPPGRGGESFESVRDGGRGGRLKVPGRRQEKFLVKNLRENQ